MSSHELLILDYHNTVYDEVLEYGLAVESAIKVWQEEARKHGHEFDLETLYSELSAAHAMVDSDWDDHVWKLLPALREVAWAEREFEVVLESAVKERWKVTGELTRKGMYPNLVETLTQVRKTGASIYLVTEARMNAAAYGVKQINLHPLLEGIYAMPAKVDSDLSQGLHLYSLPKHQNIPGRTLEKPHGLVLLEVVIHEAKRRGLIPQEVGIEELVDFQVDDKLSVDRLEQWVKQCQAHHGENAQSDARFQQAMCALEAIRTRVVLKKGKHHDALARLLSKTLHMGDSLFKDGFMAARAGVKFVWAKYGNRKDYVDPELHAYSRDIMYKVTGWDNQVIRLTQEASESADIQQKVEPFLICPDSPADLLELFR